MVSVWRAMKMLVLRVNTMSKAGSLVSSGGNQSMAVYCCNVWTRKPLYSRREGMNP